MMLTVMWRPDSLGIRKGETTVQANTVLQLRTAGVWTKTVAVKMEWFKRKTRFFFFFGCTVPFGSIWDLVP